MHSLQTLDPIHLVFELSLSENSKSRQQFLVRAILKSNKCLAQ